jgi:hypothetical protein
MSDEKTATKPSSTQLCEIKIKGKTLIQPATIWTLTVYHDLINSGEKADVSIFRSHYPTKCPERLGESHKQSRTTEPYFLM